MHVRTSALQLKQFVHKWLKSYKNSFKTLLTFTYKTYAEIKTKSDH